MKLKNIIFSASRTSNNSVEVNLTHVGSISRASKNKTNIQFSNNSKVTVFGNVSKKTIPIKRGQSIFVKDNLTTIEQKIRKKYPDFIK